MLQLTVTAKLSDVVLQDPFPADGQWSLVVPAGDTKTVTISWDQFQRIALQVKELEDANFCTVVMESISNGEVRGQENDLVGMPALDYIYLTGGGAGFELTKTGETDLCLVGDQLLAQQGVASVTLGDSATPNAQVTFYSPAPGIAGNDITVEITESGGPGLLTITVAGTDVSIELNGTGSDAGTVATAVNTAVTGARGTVFAVAGGTGLGVVLEAAQTSLTGGTGAGMSVTLGGEPCVIVSSFEGALSTDPHTVTVDTPDLDAAYGAAAGEAVNLHLRSGNKKTSSTHLLK